MLVDTNVLSEITRRTPDPAVIAWFDQQDIDSLFISVLTLGELRYGIDRREPGRRTTELKRWLEDELTAVYAQRILDVDIDVAEQWGRLRTQQDRIGRPRPEIDGLIAATAIVHDMTVVTRNERDFRWLGLDIVNPFDPLT